ncbi:Methyltransferase type 11 domain-containing protein OS=Rhizobacter sp. Root404 OX=1736528 GN=ASC76_02100 PE=4 SV=1 [Rhizobacter fulvus]
MVIAEDLVLAYKNYYTVAAPSSSGSPGSAGLTPTFSRLDRLFTRLLRLEPERDRHADTYLHDTAPGALLDVGCGSGDFAAHMRRLGWRCQGTEFDPDAARHARETHGIEVELGDISQIRYEDERFDAITARHVIEHVREPADFLAECWRILKPGGRLVLLTPNADSLGHRHFGPRWRGLEQPRHLYLFNPMSMQALFERQSIAGADVFSSAQGASYTLNASAKTAQGLMQRSIDQCAIWFLQVRETVLTRRGAQVGEDLVAIATKPRGRAAAAAL